MSYFDLAHAKDCEERMPVRVKCASCGKAGEDDLFLVTGPARAPKYACSQLCVSELLYDACPDKVARRKLRQFLAAMYLIEDSDIVLSGVPVEDYDLETACVGEPGYRRYVSINEFREAAIFFRKQLAPDANRWNEGIVTVAEEVEEQCAEVAE